MEGKRVPIANFKNVEERELKPREFDREKLSSNAGAEEWTPFPGRS